MDRPLATFALFSYNQEKYIREAIEGAFSQTYSPLEIILSDDGSADGTFRIMEEMAAGYSGPHTVILNRNPVNRGLIAHINHVIPMARGEWIVMAAGDDISLPARVARSIHLALANPRNRSVFVGFEPIGEKADFRSLPDPPPGILRLADVLHTLGASGLGACQAFHRDVWDRFGMLPPGLLREDAVLPFRASLLGEVEIDVEKHVLYRVAQGSLSMGYQNKPTTASLRKTRIGELAEVVEIERNIEEAARLGMIERDVLKYCKEEVREMAATAMASVKTLDGNRWSRIIHGVLVLCGGSPYKELCGNWKFRISLALQALR
jgi:glycosyltransferase involved in cell wall biosynthesis